ncbi:hypothetical protein PVK06_039219 [Gossypium arboreum]|uniref:Uncharacterized protein n=1 Tax=Gossypium arboreum TaxID=29729 RepID=A0ABR0N317_GOSAR|nr:hypothetical protein PVK06_039219 [Gossypium arboreum]
MEWRHVANVWEPHYLRSVAIRLTPIQRQFLAARWAHDPKRQPWVDAIFLVNMLARHLSSFQSELERAVLVVGGATEDDNRIDV